MLCRLKITVHNIASTPPNIPKGSLNYNLHVLTRAVSLHHLFIPLLSYYTEAPLSPFTPPPLDKTLVTLAHQSPLLSSPSFPHKAPSKSCQRVSFRKFRALFCSPIAYTMPLKDLLHYSKPTFKPTSRNNLCVSILWV